MPEKVKITVWGYRCERCSHEWVPIREQAPRVCPRCKSPYWDRARRPRSAAGRPGPGQGEG
jgi:predicted Zn-ribbon and HTH transcriptional regulator